MVRYKIRVNGFSVFFCADIPAVGVTISKEILALLLALLYSEKVLPHSVGKWRRLVEVLVLSVKMTSPLHLMVVWQTKMVFAWKSTASHRRPQISLRLIP